MKRLSPSELDEIGIRLEQIAEEEDSLRSKLKEQIDEFGFTPARAEKSKRLEGSAFQFTLTCSESVEIHDSEVERIKEACPGPLFSRLFSTVTKYKLVREAVLVLAAKLPPEAPNNLRSMFAKAVQIVPKSPSLRIERVKEQVPA